jgi:hypothetical protein
LGETVEEKGQSGEQQSPQRQGAEASTKEGENQSDHENRGIEGGISLAVRYLVAQDVVRKFRLLVAEGAVHQKDSVAQPIPAPRPGQRG